MIQSLASTQPRAAWKKVPEITVYFWLVKLLTTAMGEVFSDALVHRAGATLALTLGGVGLIVALALQLSVRRYHAGLYWAAAAMIAIFGTMAADVVHSGFGVPYGASTIAFAVALAAVFGVWYASEHTLSVHSIVTPRREWFYWATVIVTFALGTAAGDMTATTMHLGFLASGVLFAVAIAAIALAYWRFNLNAIVAFWAAYILTRPLGASFADWAGHPRSRGGLGLGSALVSAVLLVLIMGMVGYLSLTRKDVPMEQR